MCHALALDAPAKVVENDPAWLASTPLVKTLNHSYKVLLRMNLDGALTPDGAASEVRRVRMAGRDVTEKGKPEEPPRSARARWYAGPGEIATCPPFGRVRCGRIPHSKRAARAPRLVRMALHRRSCWVRTTYCGRDANQPEQRYRGAELLARTVATRKTPSRTWNRRSQHHTGVPGPVRWIPLQVLNRHAVHGYEMPDAGIGASAAAQGG